MIFTEIFTEIEKIFNFLNRKIKKKKLKRKTNEVLKWL